MNQFNLSPAWAGFLKGLLTVVVFAAIGFCANAANLAPIIGGTLATIIAGAVAAWETAHASANGGSTALFGAVRIKRKNSY